MEHLLRISPAFWAIAVAADLSISLRHHWHWWPVTTTTLSSIQWLSYHAWSLCCIQKELSTDLQKDSASYSLYFQPTENHTLLEKKQLSPISCHLSQTPSCHWKDSKYCKALLIFLKTPWNSQRFLSGRSFIHTVSKFSSKGTSSHMH